MNGVPEYYEVKMKQSSKGIWYCDGFTASTETLENTLEYADIAMKTITKILEKRNKEAEK